VARLLADVAVARVLLGLAAAYAGVGGAVGAAFVLFGVRRSVAAEGSVTIGARLLLFPAALALWPLVLKRWIAAARAP
jgi:hypothetical protein